MRRIYFGVVGLSVVMSCLPFPATAAGKPKAKNAKEAMLSGVSATLTTSSGRRSGNATLNVVVQYGEGTLASNYEKPSIAPGVTFSAGMSGDISVPVDKWSKWPKSLVKRVLREGTDFYVETFPPETWLFDVTATFTFTDGSSLVASGSNCGIKPGSERGSCTITLHH